MPTCSQAERKTTCLNPVGITTASERTSSLLLLTGRSGWVPLMACMSSLVGGRPELLAEIAWRPYSTDIPRDAAVRSSTAYACACGHCACVLQPKLQPCGLDLKLFLLYRDYATKYPPKSPQAQGGRKPWTAAMGGSRDGRGLEEVRACSVVLAGGAGAYACAPVGERECVCVSPRGRSP